MFKEPVFQKTIDNHGFSLIPFLDNEEVFLLRKLYTSNFEDINSKGMFANHNTNDVEKSKLISSEIIEILNTKLNQYFKNFQPFVAHFVVKSPQNHDEFSLHQDWNIVDEKKYKSYHIWIPLSLTHEKNGGMFVVPNSHKFFANHRSGSLGSPSIPSSKELDNIKISLKISNNNALVWDDAVFHGSFPNNSNESRISVVLVIHDINAPTFYFHKNKTTKKLDVFSLTSNLLLENLTTLEKGQVPINWSKTMTLPSQTLCNTKIGSENLLMASKQRNLIADEVQILPIFKETTTQIGLNKNGYIIIKDFLDFEQVKNFNKIFNSTCDLSRYSGMARYTSMEKESLHNRNMISNIIQINIRPLLDELLINYKCPIFQYFVKMSKSDGNVGLHTDTTLLLNPQIESHYGLWLPLQNVNEYNGALKVIPKSHTWYNGVYTNSNTWPFLPFIDKIEKKAISLDLKAGDLVVFDNRLIHGSTYNASNNPRICIAGRVTHKHSQYYSFFKEKNSVDDLINVYKEADDFYLNKHFKGDKEISLTGQFVGKIYQPKLNEAEFLRKLNE
jgi:ectoine hydroxylase-related dioxygenase (phytanoyl-CoA dioxygenase family)